MAQNADFRSAFNGFNREDVVHYLEYLQNKHTTQLNQLRADLAAAEAERDNARELQDVIDDLRQQYAELEAEKDAALARADALEAALCAARSEKAAEPVRNEEELEAYRRAERAERQAQQRAEQLMAQAHGILADAGTRADESAQRIGAMADQVAAQLAALQQAVIGSKSALQETAMAIYAIRPQD